jgi:hypothetical protein
VTDRWQDDHDRRARIVGLLAEVERFRLEREAAIGIASARDLDDWMQRRADDRVLASRKGLDAAIYIALADASRPPVDDVAAAAGETVEYVEAVRERVNRPRS